MKHSLSLFGRFINGFMGMLLLTGIFGVAANAQDKIFEDKLGAGDSIRIDGKLLGTGQWEGKLTSGIHAVQVSAEGKRPYQSDVGVEDGQLANVRVTLEGNAAAQRGAAPVWPWIAGGAAALAGLSVGAYFLFRPRDEGPPAPVDGSLDPGSIPLALRF